MDRRDRMTLSAIQNRKKNKGSYREVFNNIIGLVLSRDESRKQLKGVENYLNYKLENDEKVKETDDIKPRLVVSDLHLPFAVDGWLDFIINTHEKYNCHEELIINGDLLDLHQYSFHASETDAMSGIDEFEKAKEDIQKLVSAFPKVKLTMGNHDFIIIRRMKEIGIDQRFMKTFHELLDLPDTWEIADDFIVDNVYYKHIGCCGGKTGHINSAISNRMSTVSSHLHANGGISYVTSPTGESIFGLNTGALVDDNAYALRYGKHSRFKSTLGCGLVYSNKEAYFVPKI